MKRIKVLHVVTVLDRGGLETMLMNYFRNFNMEVFEFHFLVHRQDGVYEREILEDGGIIHRVSSLNFSIKNFLKYQKELDLFFKSQNFDIVHVHNNSFGYYPLKYAKKYGVPVRIIHSHISSLQDDIKKVMLGKYLNRKIPKVANQLYACGEEAGKWMFKNNSFKVVPNAIDSQLFSYNAIRRDKVRQEFDCGNNICIVNVARFNPQKNHMFLLETFAEILKRDPHYHLYLIGEGHLKKDIVDKINALQLTTKVSLLGIRNNIDELLQGMDVFLFPSLFEGLPVSLIEAQSSGIRCVVSDGIPEEAILVSENVKVISLEKSASQWAKEIIEYSKYDRVDVSNIIKQKGYDIFENAKELEMNYKKLLQKFS